MYIAGMFLIYDLYMYYLCEPNSWNNFQTPSNILYYPHFMLLARKIIIIRHQKFQYPLNF